MSNIFDITKAMRIMLPKELPEKKPFINGVRRAPDRVFKLNQKDTVTAIKNALRYVHPEHHEIMASEFLEELTTMGRVYGYRFRPDGAIKAKPVHEYKGKILEAKAVQLMIDNNLDFDVALYPYELVTYGESGQVCQNWMQYLLIKRYLEEMNVNQTLVVQSGHPLGLFPSSPESPRVISTNGLMIGMFDNPADFHTATAMGVTNYGQMTAGGWMYIGPQGIVHGTYITLLNAGRLYLGLPHDQDLRGKVFVSSGLGGMSGAQAKAIEISGGVGVIAEVDYSRIQTRINQGWVGKVSSNLEEVITWMKQAMAKKTPLSIAYYGNVVDLWQYIVDNNIYIDLGSDQTSCHAVYEGGYTPQGLSFENGRELMKRDLSAFKEAVNRSLGLQFGLIHTMVKRGMHFWDYGNSFLKAVFDAGCKEISKNEVNTRDGFIFPSYVEDIMGPMCFDYGYGPFRWICLSCDPKDLEKTDKAAMECIDPSRRGQDRDNYCWIQNAQKNKLVVGSQARILYSDACGRVKIALKFNDMVRKGEVGPIMMGRDHHDTQGTDSPFRETANIKDGSNVCADMSIHCFAGNAARGVTMVVQSNGGGVGVGKAFNSGYGLVLDGSERVDMVVASALEWDVMGGVARRAWARNENAIEVVSQWNQTHTDSGYITLPFISKGDLVEEIVAKKFK